MKISYYNLFLFLILPFFLLSRGFYFLKFTIITPIVLILFIFIFFTDLKIRYISSKKKYYFFPILTLISGLSLIKASGVSSYVEFAHILTGLIFIILFNNIIVSKSDLKMVIRIVNATILVLCFHFFVIRFFSLNIEDLYSNVNRLTTFLVFFSPVYFSNILANEKQSFNIIMLITILITIIVAGSRFNFVAFFIQFVIFLLMLIRKMNIKQKKTAIGILVIIVILFSLPIMYNIAFTQGQSISEQAQNKASSLMLRLYLTAEGANIIKESKFMGVGAGNIKIKNFWTGVPEEFSLHNFFIHLTATYGIITLLIFLLMYRLLWIDYKFLSSNNKKIDTGFYEITLLSFLISFLVSSSSPSSLFKLRPFYFIFAFHYSYIRIFRSKIIEYEKN